jgi:hypothetical protein
MADQRPTRAEEVRTERRRKPGSVILSGLKLGVPEEMLDRNTYEYRWANDKGNRIRQLHDADWDRVSEAVKEDVDGMGSIQSKIVGTEDGKPVNAVLMRKRKDWYQADQKEKSNVLDAMDDDIRRGKGHTKESPELSGGIGYTPNGQNKIDG